MVRTMRKCNDGRPVVAAATTKDFSSADGRQHDRNAAANGGTANEHTAASADKPSPGVDGRHGQHGNQQPSQKGT